jgi:hypothetical protein
MTDDFESSDTDTAEAGGWDGYAEDGGTAEGAGAPDLNEAIAQMQAQQARISERLGIEDDEEEYDGLDYGLEPGEMDDEELLELAAEQGYLGDDDDENWDDEAELSDLIDRRVQDAVVPFVADMEYNRRVEALHALAERYDDLTRPQTIEEVSAEVQRIGEAYGLEGADTDPAWVELVLQARAGRRVGNAELAEPEPPTGAVLETGVGPSPKTEELDPQTKAYMDVIAGPGGQDNAFTR